MKDFTVETVVVNDYNSSLHARFEVFTAVKIQVEVFWVVTPCSVVINIPKFHRSLKMKEAWIPKTSVSYHNTRWHCNPEDLELTTVHYLTSIFVGNIQYLSTLIDLLCGHKNVNIYYKGLDKVHFMHTIQKEALLRIFEVFGNAKTMEGFCYCMYRDSFSQEHYNFRKSVQLTKPHFRFFLSEEL